MVPYMSFAFRRMAPAARARSHRPRSMRPALEALEPRVALSPGGVTAISRYPNGHQIDVFTTDSSGTVWGDYWRDSTGWGKAYTVPGLHATPGTPVAVLSRYPDGHQIDVFTTDTSGAVRGDWWSDYTGWGTAYTVPGLHATPGTPVVALSRYPDGHQIDVFTTDTSGAGYVQNQRWSDYDGWLSLRSFDRSAYDVPGLHPAPEASVTALSRYPDGHQIDVFTTDTSGAVLANYWRNSDGWHKAYTVPGLRSAGSYRL